jgi:Cu/Ag efflux pump CusA
MFLSAKFTNNRLVAASSASGCQSLTAVELAQTVVAYKNGIGVRLADVANVVVAPAPPVGASTINGRLGLTLIVENQYGVDPIAVTQSVTTALRT